MKNPTDPPPFPTPKRSSSRRTKSFSFSSSSSSSSPSNPDSPLTPTIPLPFSNGIPFSWEQQPGIPKQPNSLSSNPNRPSSLDLLPLPPASISTTPKKKSQEIISAGPDPFITALLECSKDHQRDPVAHHWKGERVSRSLSDRFGFIDLYVSCKRTCTVTDSHVFLPRPNRPAYDLLNRRSG
ncbi:early nodulin-20 [Magnolia sinica]|uniref:early nodulin-20 n=1 Tax=Magnolia sinica TaxID=86752 RepID=UPI00265ACC9C|nr:early nodulin-20 [Magnolia sinica]